MGHPGRHDRPGGAEAAVGLVLPEWLLKHRRRAEQALVSAVATSYLLGVSTRRVEKLAEQLGVTRLSNSEGLVREPNPAPGVPARIGGRGDLPRGGDRPYVPPGRGKSDRERGKPGYLDKYRNRWEWDRLHKDHWDVQHKNGKHTNVTPDGTVLGDDNFPNAPRPKDSGNASRTALVVGGVIVVGAVIAVCVVATAGVCGVAIVGGAAVGAAAS